MVARGGEQFQYESWCAACMKVTPHFHGQCLTCTPERPAPTRGSRAVGGSELSHNLSTSPYSAQPFLVGPTDSKLVYPPATPGGYGTSTPGSNARPGATWAHQPPPLGPLPPLVGRARLQAPAQALKPQPVEAGE